MCKSHTVCPGPTLTGSSPAQNNDVMSTEAAAAPVPFAAPIPPEVMADIQAVAESLAAGRPIPPEVVARVRERGERLREEIYRKNGLLDLGVPAIREFRGELPG